MLALTAAVLLLAGAPGSVMAQTVSKASQTVTFAVVPVHTAGALQASTARSAEKVTFGSVRTAGSVADSLRMSAFPPPRPGEEKSAHVRPSREVIVTITQ